MASTQLLHTGVQANWLRQDAGVAAGDTVTIYMPMGPEIVICMVSHARRC
jgi:acyl-coenzyme A synthetase/AMP-(fatty) acid ligase